jgi:hypothetical protein
LLLFSAKIQLLIYTSRHGKARFYTTLLRHLKAQHTSSPAKPVHPSLGKANLTGSTNFPSCYATLHQHTSLTAKAVHPAPRKATQLALQLHSLQSRSTLLPAKPPNWLYKLPFLLRPSYTSTLHSLQSHPAKKTRLLKINAFWRISAPGSIDL